LEKNLSLKKKRSGVIKSRLVAEGHMQDKSLYSVMHTSAPTVSTDALLILLAVFAQKKCKVVTIDIVSAYLNCDIEKKVYMSLDKLMVELLIKLDPTYKNVLMLMEM
jgi:Reverse transcriptase (RNA-dependent DNA polymerase)